ncbi:glycosyltransferase family 2 protein [Streptomyces sp. NBC_01530]|uniref:glycosyltransferase family 2 protein n=1 Tax=Streptomyces sp. NBC_01530 TaxID=2903895 RepID=UPI0038632868
MQPDLSVVIPVYDSELYLEACLDSIARQSLKDLEVILVDDGSTDRSRHIAQDFTERDDRFRLVCQDNAGCGAARNAGLPHATGRYITFSDCDDILAEDAYARLVGSLEETGSDVACGGVRRFNQDHEWPSPLHQGIFDQTRKRTHITHWPALIDDRTVWNKVYRRSFWNQYDLVYAEHPFEDGCLAVQAHVLASAVDVLAGPVYFWRSRDEGSLSTTQRKFDPVLLDGRIQQVMTISGFIAQRAPQLKRLYHKVALEHDMLILLNTLPQVDPELRERIMKFATNFCRNVEQGIFEELSGSNRDCYSLLLNGDLEQLLEHLTRRPQTDFL